MRLTILAALLLAGLPAVAHAEEKVAAEVPATTATASPPDASAVLFEQAQMKNTAPGSTLTYEYLRRSGIAKGPYGPPLSDQIKLMIEPGNADDNRTIRVQLFSGGNRMPAGPFTDMPANPVVTLFLENHLKALAALLQANPRYLKNAIRKGLREKASVTATQIEYKGKKVDAWRVEAKPFVGDPQTERMRGFDSMTYTFVTSPAVPGEIVSIEAQAKMPDGGELLEEKIDYDQDAG